MTTDIQPSANQSAPKQSFYSQSPSLAHYSRANTIDLTVDNDECTPDFTDRHTKRPRTNSDANKCSFSSPVAVPPSQTLAVDNTSVPTSVNSPQSLPPFHQLAGTPFGIAQSPFYRPPFNSPSSPSAFFSNRNSVTGQSHVLANNPTPTTQNNMQDRHVIDLTASPSPPPSQLLNNSPFSQQQQQQQQQHHQCPSTQDPIDPKRPVCIGQLTITALVLYPSEYLQHQPGQSSSSDPSEDIDWACVKLQYDFSAKARSQNGEETIQVQRPRLRSDSGDMIPEDSFGVVEQKVSKIIGPLLAKGLIRLDGKVRRGVPNVPILPLQLLVQTPYGNIPVVGRYFQEHGLLLDHPSQVWDRNRLAAIYYQNPHNPPPGGFARSLHPTYGRPYSGPAARWCNSPVSGKSVELQREQIDDLFKGVKNDDEINETEPSPDIATKLYPHQKKALTFLLQREGEIKGTDGRSSSIWQYRRRGQTGEPAWVNLVTLKESPTEPAECKGAILADDMGLGKTITCVSLIAATLPAARKFAELELPVLQKPTQGGRSSPGPSAAQFSGAVWGMPDTSAQAESSGMSKKKAAQAAKVQEKLEAEYTRLARIKVRSRATLIVCPLSTVVNWEDQFKEHWAGEVQITGGSGANCVPQEPAAAGDTKPTDGPVCTPCDSHDNSDPSSSTQPRNASNSKSQTCSPLRVYIYHGNARRPDPSFLADFDAVITTYATLASEYSKQMKSLVPAEPEENLNDECADGSGQSSSQNPENDTDECKLQTVLKKGVKRKKAFCLMNGTSELSSPLQSLHWFRVVLDEAHSIKETSTVGCRASCDLMADRRLCLTGTPVQNKLDDVYALIKFLRLAPLDDRSVWQEYIGTPVKFAQQHGVARLQTVMKVITLRRTKESKAKDGQKILSLPPRQDELRLLKFDEKEQKIYDAFFVESRDEFKRLKRKNEVMKNYVGILQQILRLRQICDHFELVDGKGPNDASLECIIEAINKEGISGSRANAVFTLIRDSGTAQCVECGFELGGEGAQNEGAGAEPNPGPKRGRRSKASSRAPTRANSPAAAPRIVMSRCQHLFCMECFCNCVFPGWPNISHEETKACTACQTLLRPTDAAEVNPAECCSAQESAARKRAARKERRQRGLPLENFHPSTKVRALLGDLITSSRMNPHSINYDPESVEICMVDENGKELDDGIVKTVVFSQWTTMLDKIEDALETAGIRYERLDGTMKRDDRTRAMEALKNDPGCEVILVSLKAGGVGLNLTAAQRVYLMDPYWNPAVEHQAVDRIHRLGQTRPVTTVKLIIENTIEARLLDVQKKKIALANMTLGQHLSKADILSRRVEELSQLLR